MLNWSNQFNICCFLDNNNYQFGPNNYECLAGVGAQDMINASSGNALQELKTFLNRKSGWLFGHLGYDVKNEIEQLSSLHPDNISFPDLFFFAPQVVLLLNKNELAICSNHSLSAQQIFASICNTEPAKETSIRQNITVQGRFSKQEYIETIIKLQQHILHGDCYEINFCQEFFAEHIILENPLQVYQSLGLVSPAPFAAYYKIAGKYLLCASPERYLKKQGNKIISQPIKGTGRRDQLNTEADLEYKQALYNSPKDRSENIMVVDLVRNDLSRICMEGTVTVEELFGIYSFTQVHQMVSTIAGTLRPGIDFTGMISETFPMGSMTGAPKRKVLQLIEQYEKTKRGIFSGAIGYIEPSGDFDFNVVIRSILYNQANRYLSYQVGSGITFYSNAEQEYDECLLKAGAIKKVLA